MAKNLGRTSGKQAKNRPRTIRSWEQHFEFMYREANECRFRHGLTERINFLQMSIHRLMKAIDRADTQLIPGCLARILARTMTVTQHFNDLPFLTALAGKWMGTSCSYCGQTPCDCKRKRRPPRVIVNPSTRGLTFNKLTRRVGLLYGERNRRNDVSRLVNRLLEEGNELMKLASVSPKRPLTVETMRWRYALEASDVCAWVAAIADYLKVDLDRALEERYGSHCPSCSNLPCACPIDSPHADDSPWHSERIETPPPHLRRKPRRRAPP